MNREEAKPVCVDVPKTHGCMRWTGNIKEEGLERMQRETGRGKDCKMHPLGRMHPALAVLTSQQPRSLHGVYTEMDWSRGSEALHLPTELSAIDRLRRRALPQLCTH